MMASDRRGSVALMTGIMLPAMVMGLAMGVEVTSWSVAKVELQRTADLAAWAGARQYAATGAAQGSTGTAADLAEINGVSGTASRSWDAGTLMTTDNLVTAQVVNGVRNVTGKAMKVTVKQSIAKAFTRIFPSTATTVLVSASATAEISGSPQPCLLALNGSGNGVVTGTDILISGSANISSDNCSVRSDAGISLSGSSSLNVAGTYAGGAITTSGSSSITGGSFPNSGQVDDPYAAYAPMQNALSGLGSGGSAVNVGGSATSTISPGTYSSMSVSGSARLTLNPGLYMINGNVSFSGSGSVTGNGVTIIASGTLTTSGSASVSLKAPTLAAPAGGIPGVLFASKSNQASAFSGSSSLPFAGLIYYPNGNIAFSGSSSGGSTGCTQVVAGVITLSGSSNLSARCDTYGTLKFGSLPSGSAVALVR
ncbi:MAG: pilus assembly protein TadG-related protein [Acetobacteraceae bacterium]